MDGYRYAGVVDKKGRIISMIEDKKNNRENNQNTKESVDTNTPELKTDEERTATETERRTWKKTLEMLRTEYTISLRDICKIMRTSRQWVNQFITPNVKKIFLDNGYTADRKTRVSWTQAAALILNNQKYLKDSVWICKQDFKELIEQNIISCTRQTIKIPVELLVSNEKYQEFVKKYKKLDHQCESILEQQEFAEINDYMALVKMYTSVKKSRDNCFKEYLSPEGMELLMAEVNIVKRKETVPVSISLPKDYINHWEAPHDLKDYGDTDESVYRKFFREGYTRIEIAIQSKEKTSQKIYYVPEQVSIKAKNVEQYITIGYKAWENLNHAISEEIEKRKTWNW